MRIGLCFLLVLCGGCSSLLPFGEQPAMLEQNCTATDTALSRSEAVANVSGILQPRRSIDTLITDRLAICNTAEERRVQFVQSLQTEPSAEQGVNEALLNKLLLASCSPAKTPGVLNQILADLTSAGTWPEQYAAFFDLMISGQRAYATVEKVYLDLKLEHEKTIQGLSEIETQIELQNAKLQR